LNDETRSVLGSAQIERDDARVSEVRIGRSVGVQTRKAEATRRRPHQRFACEDDPAIVVKGRAVRRLQHPRAENHLPRDAEEGIQHASRVEAGYGEERPLRVAGRSYEQNFAIALDQHLRREVHGAEFDQRLSAISEIGIELSGRCAARRSRVAAHPIASASGVEAGGGGALNAQRRRDHGGKNTS
jgi:hypothetical protein